VTERETVSGPTGKALYRWVDSRMAHWLITEEVPGGLCLYFRSDRLSKWRAVATPPAVLAELIAARQDHVNSSGLRQMEQEDVQVRCVGCRRPVPLAVLCDSCVTKRS